MTMNIRNTIKKNLQEIVGVIPNVDATANKIYRSLISTLESDKWTANDWLNKKDKEYNFSGDFSVGEFDVDNVNINLVMKNNEHADDIVLSEMGLGIGAEIENDSKFVQNLPDDEINIQIVLWVNFDSENIKNSKNDFNQYVVNFIEDNKPKFISSLSHEVGHAYAVLKKHPISVLQRAYYEGSMAIRFPRIVPIQNIIFDFYFAHMIEDLVRPNELDTLFKDAKVTPKEFYDALTNSRVYKRFKEMRDFNYENIIQDLKDNYMDAIDELFTEAGAPEEILSLSDEDKVNALLDFTSQQLRTATTHKLLDMVIDENPTIKMMVNLLGSRALPRNKLNYFNQSTSKILKKFPEDGQQFLKRAIKDLNILGDKMTKKISKLYSIVNNKEYELSKIEKYKRHKQ